MVLDKYYAQSLFLTRVWELQLKSYLLSAGWIIMPQWLKYADRKKEPVKVRLYMFGSSSYAGIVPAGKQTERKPCSELLRYLDSCLTQSWFKPASIRLWAPTKKEVLQICNSIYIWRIQIVQTTFLLSSTCTRLRNEEQVSWLNYCILYTDCVSLLCHISFVNS